MFTPDTAISIPFAAVGVPLRWTVIVSAVVIAEVVVPYHSTRVFSSVPVHAINVSLADVCQVTLPDVSVIELTVMLAPEL